MGIVKVSDGMNMVDDLSKMIEKGMDRIFQSEGIDGEMEKTSKAHQEVLKEIDKLEDKLSSLYEKRNGLVEDIARLANISRIKDLLMDHMDSLRLKLQVNKEA